MFRALTALALSVVAAGVLAAQEPQFRAASHTVSIYASVFDRTGRMVPDLGRDAFEVLDDGVPQPLTVFANDVQPITIVLMLDRSGSMALHFDLVREAAEQFVANLLPSDRVRIGSFSNRIQIDPVDFTGDREALVNVLRHKLQEAGPTPLWRATSTAMTALAGQQGRRVVLMFTDGMDTPALGRNVTFADVLAQSQREEVMVYGIGLSDECEQTREASPSRSPRIGGGGILFQRPGGLGQRGRGGRGGPFGRPGIPGPNFPPPIGGVPPRFPVPPPDPAPSVVFPRRCTSRGPDPDLRELSAASGGGYFELRSTDNLASTFARIADELHHQYLLAFTAPVLDNRVHRLEVRVKPSALTARARQTYLATASE